VNNLTNMPASFPIPPLILIYVEAIRPTIILLLVSMAWLAISLPLIISLFLFSTKQSRRTPIFYANALSILLGISMGILNVIILVCLFICLLFMTIFLGADNIDHSSKVSPSWKNLRPSRARSPIRASLAGYPSSLKLSSCCGFWLSTLFNAHGGAHFTPYLDLFLH
jgi:hypothetical protein